MPVVLRRSSSRSQSSSHHFFGNARQPQIAEIEAFAARFAAGRNAPLRLRQAFRFIRNRHRRFIQSLFKQIGIGEQPDAVKLAAREAEEIARAFQRDAF